MTDAAGDRLARERERVAELVHGGVVQQVTALSLAVDNALLHHAAGDAEGVAAALRTARELADRAATGCRALIDELRGDGGP